MRPNKGTDNAEERKQKRFCSTGCFTSAASYAFAVRTSIANGKSVIIFLRAFFGVAIAVAVGLWFHGMILDSEATIAPPNGYYVHSSLLDAIGSYCIPTCIVAAVVGLALKRAWLEASLRETYTRRKIREMFKHSSSRIDHGETGSAQQKHRRNRLIPAIEELLDKGTILQRKSVPDPDSVVEDCSVSFSHFMLDTPLIRPNALLLKPGGRRLP